ncbi:MAG: transglutaminase domain-containing protein [Oliverpabstia sp.]
MKKLWKILGICIWIVMPMLLPCVKVWGNTSQDIQTVETTYINPLYEGTIQESDLRSQEISGGVSAYSEKEYTDSLEEASSQMREGMKQKADTIVIYYQAGEYSEQLIKEIANQAMVHTGNPIEGDYLKWQYGGWKASTSYYKKDGSTYMDITYTVTYYTTAEQETAVDEKIQEVFSELQLEEKSDYGKVQAVYDYICEHTVYDNDNLKDDDYTLKYTAYAALIDGKAVCQGYAVLFYRMVLELNVDSRLIAGIGNGEAHGWNIVKLDGSYYNVDATWDAGKTEYVYFLKCQENFAKHIRDEAYDTAEFHEEYPMAAEDYSAPELEPPVITSVYSRVQTSVKVTWTQIEGVDGYELFRAADPETEEDEWTRVKTVADSSIVQYTNSGLEKGETYYYKVRSFKTGEDDTSVYSSYSNIAYMPAAVAFDHVYSNSTSRIRLIWNQVRGSHGYQIWRKNEDGSYSVVKTLGDKGNELTNDQGETTAYSNTGLESGEKYVYRMRAFAILDGKKVYGSYSDDITVAVMPEAPELVISNVKTDRVTLSWNHVNGAAGYQVWRAEEADGAYTIVKSIEKGDAVSYVNSGLTSGKTYYYKVRAYTELDSKKTFGEYSEIQSALIK